MDKTYTIEIGCRNCGVAKKISIIVGMTVRDFCRMNKCSNCGCRIDGSDQLVKKTKYACKGE